ncbi:MAG: TonB-dependent receptor [Gemmatimonadota bacterium]|nr:TonB-dependent receptor [Gemmatimonadota bacterium]
MIALLAELLLQLPPLVRGRVIDARSSAPVVGAMASTATSRAVTDDAGAFELEASAGDTVRVRRIGYRPARDVVRDRALVIALEPVAFPMSVVRVEDSAQIGHLVATRSHDALREQGLSSMDEVLSRLPFVSARGSRGQVALSMRGSRPGQLLVLLDGVPLNDPATGAADVADIPLSALGTVRAVPGAAASSLGSGASGGVLDLTTASTTEASLRAGSLGALGIGLSGRQRAGQARLQLGGELSRATNDYAFVNDGGAADTLERRRNEDERRGALFGSLLAPSLQIALLYTGSERGLAGPMNVRALDAARGTSERGLLRLSLAPGGSPWQMSGALRTLATAYRNPGFPTQRATSLSGDLEVGRRAGQPAVEIRAGLGADRVSGTALPDSMRPRAFLSAGSTAAADVWSTRLELRGDAIRGAGVRLSPSLAVERRGPLTLFARVAQGFRAPSFYDLYFASPQWIDPSRVLAPERVMLDGELGARVSRGPAAASASLFLRHTADAIIWFPGTFGWSPANVTWERVQGAEGRGSLTFAAGEAEAWGGIRSTRARTADGLDVPTPYVPRLDGGALARAHRGDLSLTASLTLLGRRPFAIVPRPTPSVELPAVALADLVGAWHPAKPLAPLVTVAVRNITDRRWQSIVRYPMAGRSWSVGVTLRP